jgi:hypothetical protein
MYSVVFYANVLEKNKSDVYSISVKSTFSRLRNQYSTKISFTCDPNRIEELVSEIHKVIESLKVKHAANNYIDLDDSLTAIYCFPKKLKLAKIE